MFYPEERLLLSMTNIENWEELFQTLSFFFDKFHNLESEFVSIITAIFHKDNFLVKPGFLSVPPQ